MQFSKHWASQLSLWVLLIVVSYLAVLGDNYTTNKELFYAFTDVTTSVLDPEYDFTKVKVRMNEAQLIDALVQEHKKLLCEAWFFYLQQMLFSKDEVSTWKWALKWVGVPSETYANMLSSMKSYTMSTKRTLGDLIKVITNDEVKSHLTSYLSSNGNFIPVNIDTYKTRIKQGFYEYSRDTSDFSVLQEKIAKLKASQTTTQPAIQTTTQPIIQTTTQPAVQTTPTSTSSRRDKDIDNHIDMLTFTWLVFLVDKERRTNPNKLSTDNLTDAVWQKVVEQSSFPKGIYDSLGKVLFNLTNQRNITFNALVIPRNTVESLYDNFITRNGTFKSTNPAIFNSLGDAINLKELAALSADPSVYTSEYIHGLAEKMKNGNETMTTSLIVRADQDPPTNGTASVSLKGGVNIAPASQLAVPSTPTQDNQTSKNTLIVVLVLLGVVLLIGVVTYIMVKLMLAFQTFNSNRMSS